ncbi:carboxypeptidase regulatory-like domain-containing protein [Natronococcus wangiae]|uniref:carboxypeptidase regulatory-like domain-containing protein n=1 Tax=Natronococcus wangiae TaxID=3068275 RepID=UPI00273D646A|nr:carboxypeptidase regulatory-like domain-containing protein [Natronococcus sp. AD5]
MDINRREFGTAAGISLSAILAGCGALQGDSDGDGEEGNETDWVEDDTDSDAEGANDSDTEDGQNETGGDNEPKLHEDESIGGTILLSNDAERRLAVVKHTFTWMGEPPSDQCRVHVMLENTSGAELTVDVEARIYDEDGSELSSTTDTGVEGPEPGEDDAVHSLELDNCEETAKYELEIDTPDVADDSDENTSDEDDDSNGPDEEDDADTPDDSDEPDEQDDADGDEDEGDGDEQNEENDQEEDEQGDDNEDEDEDDQDEGDDDGDDEDDDQGDEDEDEDEDDEDGTNTVRVIVQDDDEEPIDHATVELEERGLLGWSDEKDVDDQGRAEFEVEDGKYTLTVEADGYSTVEEDVEIDSNVQYTVTLHENE